MKSADRTMSAALQLVLTIVIALTSLPALADGGAATRPDLAAIFDSDREPMPESAIDKLVFARLDKLGIEPAKVCSDAVLLRRVYMDVIGTLPTEQEAKEFLASKAANKRAALIDRLLARPEFADYWALKWSDLLRIKAEFPINLWPNAVQAYHQWVRTSIKENKPYDQFVREMLTSSGSNFRVPPVNFLRAVQSKDPQALASAVALTFMGCRAEKWPKDRLAGMAGFFRYVGYKSTLEWKEEVVYFDSVRAAQDAAAAADPNVTTRPDMTAVLPDGKRVKLDGDTDPRLAFADWLISADNPYFAAAAVNRIWFWLVGRGIIHEPDDARPDNPPSNPELLGLLANELVEAKYDIKHVYRLILNSQAYQLSPLPRSRDEAGPANFASYPIRRLEAEVLIDALCQITGTTESYSSPIPEPFTWIPEDHRTITLADGSISSPFLEMFGRPPRDTGLAGERNNNPSAQQRLHLLNSSHILGKMNRSARLSAIWKSGEQKTAATRLYLTILSRLPTEAELKAVEEYSKGAETGGEKALIDLTWALINSSEFLYRH